jgi:heme-degrading monooxygenase HmoA
MPDAYFKTYSPECVEGEFSEVAPIPKLSRDALDLSRWHHALVAEGEDSQRRTSESGRSTQRAMHARVSKLEGLPEQVDELGRTVAEWVAPSLSEMEGFHGILALADRQSGKVELVTLWESEEDMHQSEEDANRLRGVTARAAGGEVEDVERYKVVLLHTS